MPCQGTLLRKHNIMPEGKVKMFTGFSSIITEQAPKGGFGAERHLTDISGLVINHLHDISTWMSDRHLRLTLSKTELVAKFSSQTSTCCLPHSCSCSGPTLQVIADSHILANPIIWMDVSLCDAGQVLLNQGRAEHFPFYFLKEGKHLQVNKGHCILLLFSCNKLHCCI